MRFFGTSTLKRCFVVAALAAGTTGTAEAAPSLTWDFTGSGGDLTKSESFADTTNTRNVVAHAINTEEPPAPILSQSSQGLGVDLSDNIDGDCFLIFCSEGPDGSVGPDADQIDNLGDDEAIVFDFGGLTEFANITVSVASADDEIRIYGSNDGAVLNCGPGAPGLDCLTNPSTLLASGAGSGIAGSPTFDLTGSGQFQYLIASVPGGGGTLFSGDGYRVKSITGTPIPAPATLGLLGLGLLAFSAVAHRRRGA